MSLTPEVIAELSIATSCDWTKHADMVEWVGQYLPALLAAAEENVKLRAVVDAAKAWRLARRMRVPFMIESDVLAEAVDALGES